MEKDVKTLSKGHRQDANIANLGYWPTDGETMKHVARLLAVEPGTEVSLFDCSCGKLDALMPLQESLSAQGAIPSLWGIELHDDRYREAFRRLAVTGLQGSILHADAISADVSMSESWASIQIFNPPYGDREYEKDGEILSVRLERIFWTKHIARTKKKTGITVAILPTQLFNRDHALTKMMGRHFQNGRVFRAATDSFNQLVIIGYRQKVVEGKSFMDEELVEILQRAGAGQVDDIPRISEADCDPWIVQAGEIPHQFSSSVLTDVMADTLLEIGKPMVNQCYQRLIKYQNRHLESIGEKETITPLRLGHVPAVIASGRLNGKFSNENGTFLFRGRRKRIVEKSSYKEEDETTGKERNVNELVHKPVTSVCYIDVTPGHDPIITEVI